MANNSEIFKQFADAIIPELKAVAKGFAPSIGSEISEDKMIIYASPYIRVLIDGRAPTRRGAKKGNPTLQQIILEWIQKKSIQPRNNISQKSLSYAIANSIHRKGTLLYQRGGGNNIFENIITENRINSLLALIADNYQQKLIFTINDNNKVKT